MSASQGTTRTYPPPLERRIRRMAKEVARGVDEVKSWLEMAAATIEAEEHFDALDDPPYVLCLNGRLVGDGLEAWDGDMFRLSFTDNPSDPFPEGVLEPRERRMDARAGLARPARNRWPYRWSSRPRSRSREKSAQPCNQCQVGAPINPLW